MIYLFMSLLLVQEPRIDYATASLWNQDYVKLEMTSDLQLDRIKGEDINSPDFGSFYYSMISNKPNYVELPTVAVNHLEIGIDLNNNTGGSFQISEIELITVGISSINDLIVANGTWKGVEISNNYFSPVEMKVTDFEKNISFYPRDLYLPEGNISKDHRLHLAVLVSNKEPARQNNLYKFKVKIHLTDVISNKKLSVLSDKTYHIVVQ